jgi:hypothetical protein
MQYPFRAVALSTTRKKLERLLFFALGLSPVYGLFTSLFGHDVSLSMVVYLNLINVLLVV